MKIEENERLAALLTAHWIRLEFLDETPEASLWRERYQRVLREFMELEKEEWQQSCPIVGCERPMPHEHKVEGPAQATKDNAP